MNLSRLSLPQRLLAGLGCVVVLAIGAASILYIALETMTSRKIRQDLNTAPPAWTDSLRSSARAPQALATLALTRDQRGDGARFVHDTTLQWNTHYDEGPYRSIVAGFGTHDDSVAWRTIAADTNLNRFAAAARLRDWPALDWVLRHSDTTVRRNILVLRIPRYAPARNAARGLVIRGLERLRHGDAAAARSDLAAAVSLGQQMFLREPTMIGTFSGRSIIASGAHGWERYATLTHDTALAATARAVLGWATTNTAPIGLMLDAPDTALALAADTSLSLGMRGEAVSATLSGWLLRPRGMLFGPPRRYRRAIAAMASDRDTDLARIAAMTAATADRLNLFRIGSLMREAGR